MIYKIMKLCCKFHSQEVKNKRDISVQKHMGEKCRSGGGGFPHLLVEFKKRHVACPCRYFMPMSLRCLSLNVISDTSSSDRAMTVLNHYHLINNIYGNETANSAFSQKTGVHFRLRKNAFCEQKGSFRRQISKR